MHNFFKKFGGLLLVPLVLWCFLPGFKELWQTYTSFWLFDNTVAAGVILALYGVFAWRYGFKKTTNDDSHFPGFLITCGFLASCTGLLLNNLFGGFQVLPPILTIFAMYIWLGFWLKTSFWKRSIFVSILLICTLPILERIQKFIGFPLRLLTAKVVSVLLQIVGAGNVSESTVITTENYATTIDLPCSGVKSIYFGGIVLLAVYFLQQIKLSIRSICLALCFFFLLIFFNIWRVFGLVYVYGVLHLIEAGDSIHVFLGVVGFVVSCVFLWYGSEYLRKSEVIPTQKSKQNLDMNKIFKLSTFFTQFNTVFISGFALLLTIVLTNTMLKLPDKKVSAIEQTNVFSISTMTTSVVPFSDKEKTLFLSSDVTFASKYALRNNNAEMSLLIVKSTSARSHHDPELCLQGLGYRLVNHETLSVENAPIQKIDIQTATDAQSPQGVVYYWYVSKDKVITDYSERVWEQFNEPNQEWVLVELLVEKSQAPTQEELERLFSELNNAVRAQML